MDVWKPFADMQEVMLTSGEKGHMLYHAQYFSPDDQWIVYDTRNDDTKIGENCCIELVHTETGQVVQLYKTQNQTRFGPGVGAATFSPVLDKVLFIHGLRNADALKPYDFTRRTGVAVSLEHPHMPVFVDARDDMQPFTAGALRGGTHAHNWSADGQWISFTYNDAVMQALETKVRIGVKDLRMVGVMAPLGPVNVPGADNAERFGGEMFSVVVTIVDDYPIPGSDQIDRAYEEGWVGENGYIRADGIRQERALAFLGDVRDTNGNKVTEVFVVDIPSGVDRKAPGQLLEGTPYTRPSPPRGASQRRLTWTTGNKFPGVQGPRHWLKSTPDGEQIFFLMKDEQENVQVHSVSPRGGRINQVTANAFSVETSFSVSPDGQFLAYGSGGRVFVTHIASGETRPVSPPLGEGQEALQAVNWSSNGKMIAYNKKVTVGDTSYYHVFLLK